MVKAIKGCLIRTEPSIKEIIMKIGENENFIIEDINDRMLFVNPRCKESLKDKVDKVISSMVKRNEAV